MPISVEQYFTIGVIVSAIVEQALRRPRAAGSTSDPSPTAFRVLERKEARHDIGHLLRQPYVHNVACLRLTSQPG
ncbi:MAG TPA: hypothetical protein VFC12_01985 [Terriglobales bacterium]|nr:hypothetical protein [Terriglobales bacterium]